MTLILEKERDTDIPVYQIYQEKPTKKQYDKTGIVLQPSV